LEEKKRWLSGEKPEEPADDARLIRSYVLGDLDQTAKEKFEERYLVTRRYSTGLKKLNRS